MGLPKQVEEAAQLAEEVHTQMFAPQPEDEPQPEEPQAEEPQVEEPQVEEPDPFEHKYNVLKGKYEAEVPRLHQELRELKEMVFNRIGDVTKKQEEPAKPEVDPLIEKFKEEYGEEYLSYLDRFTEAKARKIVEEALQQRIEPVQQQVQSVEETQMKVAQQNFVDYLDQKVEGVDWRKLWSGEDQKFLSFLEKTEPNSGFKYADIVKFHNDNWNADGLASVFKAYAAESQPVQQPPKRNPAKDALVAPNRSPAPTIPQAQDKTIWTQEMLAEFQKNDRMGKYDPEVSKAMWEDLLSAPSEGRIR